MFKRLILAIFIASLSAVASAQDGTRLPDLGSSASSIRSLAQNRQIGASMLHQMRALDMVLDDPQATQYINQLGYRLVAYAHIDKGQTFTFFIVNSNQINAFAAPGGYIGVNAGLINATQSESELAAVLAHEISHITQHHLLRSEEEARKATPLALLAMLGAVVASTHAGNSGGNIGGAVIAGGLGALQQHMITFTRGDEAEADHIGIDLLGAAGFDPDAMAGFFGRMERLLRPGSGGQEVPELLLTHPVTTHRISDAKARARAIKQRMHKRANTAVGSNVNWAATLAPIPYVHSLSNLHTTPETDSTVTSTKTNTPSDINTYAFMRERIRVLTGSTRELLIYYADNLQQKKGFDTPANRYGYALALTQSDQASKAIGVLSPLVAKQPNVLSVQLAMADAELLAGKRDHALQRYAKQLASTPGNHAIIEAYANALLANGKAKDAAKAAALIKPLLDDVVDEPTLYKVYGRACDLSGQDVRAARAYADASFLSGRATDALTQLKNLLKRPDLDYYQRARIQADIDIMTPIVLELDRRGIKPDQQGPPQRISSTQ
ncbi:MAG: M48 family metalloprotease [Xanthomonadales bacterium]|nr:M48 family metalloprotease [Xanthomonadales bacterium]